MINGNSVPSSAHYDEVTARIAEASVTFSRLNWDYVEMSGIKMESGLRDSNAMPKDLIISTYAAQLRWTGHVAIMPDERLPKKVFYGELQVGKCSQGGQKKHYKDTLKASLEHFNIPSVSWEQTTSVLGTDHQSPGNRPPESWEHTTRVLGTDHQSPGNRPPESWEQTTRILGTDHQSPGNRPPESWEQTTRVLGTDHQNPGNIPPESWEQTTSPGNRPPESWEQTTRVLGTYHQSPGNMSPVSWEQITRVLGTDHQNPWNIPPESWEHVTSVLGTDCTGSSKVALPHQKDSRWLWSKENLRSRKKAQWVQSHSQGIIIRVLILRNSKLICSIWNRQFRAKIGITSHQRTQQHTRTPHHQRLRWSISSMRDDPSMIIKACKFNHEKMALNEMNVRLC